MRQSAGVSDFGQPANVGFWREAASKQVRTDFGCLLPIADIHRPPMERCSLPIAESENAGEAGVPNPELGFV